MQTITPNTLPNYHFLFISTELGADWLFDAARAYFNRFRPTVITDFNFLRIIPEQYTVAVTALIRRDSVATWGVQLAQLRPAALYDPVIHDTLDEARRALDQRAQLSQPFGVPLINETPEAALLESIPTPMIPVQGVEGWVTVTPPPTPQPTPPPASTPLPAGDPIPSIAPTPGSLIGG
jgi:hypothetical protein